MRVSVKKVAATVPKVVHAAKFVKGMAKNAEAEAKRKRKEEFQTAVVLKAVASIPACVKKKGEIAGKVRATIPKYVNGAKQIKTAAKIGGIVTCAAAKGIVKKEIRETKEEYRRLGEEVLGRAININEGMKRELDLYFQNVERGVTQKGAVRYYLMDWDPAFDTLEMILRMRRTVAEQLPGYGSAKEGYEQIRGWVIKLGDNIGNSVYNKDIPFVSDFVGEAFHSSDREESGDSSNLASVSGAFVNGFVGTGALGTVDGIGGMIADPYGAAEGIVSMLANREEAYVMIKEAAMKAVDENLINGGWEDRSRVAGAVVFEVFSAIYSAGALSAAKAGDKAGDAGKTSKLLNKVSDAGGGIKRGISKGARKTLGGKAAKEAAEEAAEKADDILGDLARRMSGPGGGREAASASGALDDYSIVKGWLEDQGKSLELMDEGGVNIHKAEGAVDDIGKVDDVLEGGEVLERGSRAGGNIAKNFDTNDIPNLTKQEIIDAIPDDWQYTEHNGFVHIKDEAGKMRIRIDPPDKVTQYPHVHVYDDDGNLLDSLGNIVDRKSPDGHIPYKN